MSLSFREHAAIALIADAQFKNAPKDMQPEVLGASLGEIGSRAAQSFADQCCLTWGHDDYWMSYPERKTCRRCGALLQKGTST